MEKKQAIELFLRTRTEEAFCALYGILFPKVRRYFMLRSLDAMTAEELAQNVMLIVYRRVDDLREEALFYGWVFKIAGNELLRYGRQQRLRHARVQWEPLSAELDAKLTTESEAPQATRFYEWLARLEVQERELILLRFIEELSYEELAAALGLPLGTVKWRLFNVKKKLAKIILSSSRNQATNRKTRL